MSGAIWRALEALLEFALQYEPPEVLKQRIDLVAARRAEALADVAEAVKFPGSSP